VHRGCHTGMLDAGCAPSAPGGFKSHNLQNIGDYWHKGSIKNFGHNTVNKPLLDMVGQYIVDSSSIDQSYQCLPGTGRSFLHCSPSHMCGDHIGAYQLVVQFYGKKEALA
jgi:hypothetical protein